jgi:hypothetical protein
MSEGQKGRKQNNRRPEHPKIRNSEKSEVEKLRG